jgi:hypothetical protein
MLKIFSRCGPGGTSSHTRTVAVGLMIIGALGLSAANRAQPSSTVVIDNFESGTLAGWSVNVTGQGGWFIYSKGTTPPDPSKSDPNVPFNVPDPPQGRYAVVTDMDGPGTRILSRNLTLSRRFVLHLTLFYVNGSDDFYTASNLGHAAEDNQQFRIDVLKTSAAIDSIADTDVLANVFHTSPGDPARRAPGDLSLDLSRWQGQTVRLRFASADNHGPLRVGVDDIRLESVSR